MFPVRIKRRLIAAGMLSLGGCATVGPDYTGAPEMDVPSAWNHQTAETSQTQQDLSRWWLKLNDPILSSLIERANNNSLDMRFAIARVEQAEAQYGIAASQLYPTVDAVGSSVREKTSEQLTGFPSRITDYQSIGASLNWEIDLFGRIRRQTEAAEANVAASVENYRDVLVVLNAEIARTYVMTRTLQKRLALANQNVANQRETLRIVKARYKAELTSALDVNQAEQNLAGSESTIPLLNAALAQSINRLAVLLGQTPGTLNDELGAVQPIPVIPEDIVISIPRDVVRQRPDIRRAERQLAAQTASIGVATADLYPRLSLSGMFGFATSSANILDASSNFWRFGPNLVWNVFDAGRTQSQIKIEDAKAEQARVVYEKTVLSAFEDVEAGLINYREELSRLTYLNKSVDASKKTVKIAKSQYKNGLTNFQTVLDAERVLFAQEDRLADSKGALVNYLVGIYRAMGGGWNAAQVIQQINQEK